MTVGLLVVLLCMATFTTQQRNLDPTVNGDQLTCTTIKNQTGRCLPEYVCNEDHTVISTGLLIASDYRQKQPCPQGTWCCSSDDIPVPVVPDAKSDKCLAPETDLCPWCVLLYNSVDVKQSAGRPFCLGALIGSRVIITAATCIISAQKKSLYARVPNSANPKKNYTVNNRQMHFDYNSGTHEYDFGILVLADDVSFEYGKSRGACIDFQLPLQGDCVGYGFDNEGELQSTLLSAKLNSCGISGSSKDAACGSNSDQVCIVAEGGPVLCPKNNQALYLVGVSRGVCNDNDQVTLGAISQSEKWIEDRLKSMKVSKSFYTYK